MSAVEWPALYDRDILKSVDLNNFNALLLSAQSGTLEGTKFLAKKFSDNLNFSVFGALDIARENNNSDQVVYLLECIQYYDWAIQWRRIFWQYILEIFTFIHSRFFTWVILGVDMDWPLFHFLKSTRMRMFFKITVKLTVSCEHCNFFSAGRCLFGPARKSEVPPGPHTPGRDCEGRAGQDLPLQ